MKDNCLLTANECLAFTENFIHKFNGDFSQAVEKNLTSSDILYCKKSTLFLGCLNPCPVEDLVIGNAKRGVLSSKKPLGRDFIKYYLSENRITMAQDDVFNYLFFYPDNDKMFIFTVRKNNMTENMFKIMQCEYSDGKISRITDFSANAMNGALQLFSLSGMNMSLIKDSVGKEYMFDLTEKEYIYSDDKIAVMKSVKINSSSGKPSVKEYRFQYDGEYYKSFTFNDDEYKISQKRKYNEFYKKPIF